MFEKHLWKSDILSKDAGHIIPLPQVFFKHFANKNQLPGLSVNGTLVKNWLTCRLEHQPLRNYLFFICFFDILDR